MAFAKIGLAVCVAAMLVMQGESRLLCGQEIEYKGFNPIEALQVIQTRQFQEFDQFKNTLSQLKFKLETDDYFAWKRCLSEYEKEKLRYLQSLEKCKSSFSGLVQSLTARKLNAAQYEQELQKLFQQFQSEFTPAANLFKTNIKYLYDTIRDDGLRKKWWSTVKTTEEVTTSDGKTTRSSTTQIDSGNGNQRTQSITKKSQSVSSNGGYDAQSAGSSYDAKSSYGAASQKSVSGYTASQQSGSGYSASQQSGSGYSASQQSGGYETQQRSGYDAVSKTKEVKQESTRVTGSTVDNSGINFSNTQTRSGLKEGYSTNSYKASSGGYRRRRTLGLLGGGAGAGVGVGVGVGARSGLGGGGVGANVNIGLGGGRVGGNSGYGQQQESMRTSGGYGGNGNGMGGGIGNGMGGGSGGYDNSGAGGYQARASEYQESAKSEFQQAQGAGYASAQKYSQKSVASTMGGNGY